MLPRAPRTAFVAEEPAWAEALRLRCTLVVPKDHVCNTVFAHDSGDIETFDGDIKDGFMGLDIGPHATAAGPCESSAESA